MPSSDEEGEICPEIHVSEYAFVNQYGEPISFSVLPLQWSETRSLARIKPSLYEFEPSESDLLCHKLLIHEAVKWDKDLENSRVSNCGRVFGYFEFTVIAAVVGAIAAAADSILAAAGKSDSDETAISRPKSRSRTNVINFLQMPQRNITLHQDVIVLKKDKFIVNGDEGLDDDDIGEEVGGAGKSIFDPVCAICDDGGYILACEGRCLRSFHPTKAAGIDTCCESLGFVNDAQIDAIPSFLCKNCLCKKHQCFACGELGSSNNSPGQEFALCRRCPKAYHRKCLPKYTHSKNICFEYNKYKNSLQRAWENILPYNRILIYCMDHKIIRELGTPSRDHLIFPDLKRKCKMDLSYCGNNLASDRSDISGVLLTSRNLLKKPKPVQKDYDIHAGASSQRTEKSCSRQEFSPLRKQNTCITSRKFLKQDASADFDMSLARGKSKLTQTKGNLNVKLQSNETGFKTKYTNQNMHVMGIAERTKPLIDAEIEKGILALIKDVDSSFNDEEFLKSQQKISVANVCSFSCKSITFGRVEASVKAVRTALEKLEKGTSIEDAKTVCGPDVIKQIFKWKEDLAVYLGPFLHGMRYTSFGRHFTKVDKLKEIVDRLHCYVQDGDTIVDFCCGSNDFSCLLKEKLEKVGKSCSFKNYDLFQPKNDFNFEKRDWMSVNPDELPNGSRLIMGLNPPFGVKASRANKFISKALTFRPKLIILIVPRETRRLDVKEAYDLIWEDDRVLSGKARSVDIEDKQLEQWNVKAPPLYLWSRRDWTATHKAIAQQQGHAYYGPEEFDGNEHNAKEVGFNYLMQEKHDCYADFSQDVFAFGGISSILDGVPEVNDGFEPEGSRGKHMEGQFPGSSSIWMNNDLSKQHIHDNVIEMQHVGHGHMDALPEAAVDYGKALQADDLCIDMELSSPDNRLGHENCGKGRLNLGFKTEYKFRDMQTPFSAHRQESKTQGSFKLLSPKITVSAPAKKLAAPAPKAKSRYAAKSGKSDKPTSSSEDKYGFKLKSKVAVKKIIAILPSI
ncbi:Detected protein of confused Function [Hibiscus syriacus]|uniref:Detected protein of confused Function n=1 Tax=Hibiscus syriacus TaxID=106335 RepID=A0A6A2WFU5_HIBSY|nr:Detected protein of confused Function [Hibiscus syriacus]